MIRNDTAHMQLNFFLKQKFLLYVYLWPSLRAENNKRQFHYSRSDQIGIMDMALISYDKESMKKQLINCLISG